MNIKKLSDKKLGIDYNVPVYYKYDDFISEEVGRRKLHLRWDIKDDGSINPHAFKRRFWQRLSRQYEIKIVKLEIKKISKCFDYEGSRLKLQLVECFYLNISKKRMRDYKIEYLTK